MSSAAVVIDAFMVKALTHQHLDKLNELFQSEY